MHSVSDKPKLEGARRTQFSGDELARIETCLRDKGFWERPCDACGVKHRILAREPASAQYLFWDEKTNLFTNYIVAPSAPSALVWCKNCGNTWLFSLRILGLLDDGSIEYGRKDDSQDG